LPALYEELRAIGLGAPGADTISDVTACPGTDTCKLGISSSRGLAAELRRQLSVVKDMAPAARSLHVKCSGCFNSCGQHHVADIGFLGVSRNVGGRRVPHFQLVVGGEWTNNAGSFGLAIGAIPSKRVPEAMRRLTHEYVANRLEGETYSAYVARVGKKTIKGLIDEFTKVPPYEEDPSYYADWGDPREYTIGDIGVGECAGEVVSFAQFGLADSERELFEAQLSLDAGDPGSAGERAYTAMLHAARALTRQKYENLGEDPSEIVREFKARLVDTDLFRDPFAGAKFAHYLFRAHDEGVRDLNKAGAHQLIEEAQLFVEAAHQCYDRMAAQPS
jgi:sulfite reductase (ferredoxin)